MRSYIAYFSLLILSFNFSLHAQDWTDKEDESNSSIFFGGVNIGVLFANKNTATIYSGGENITPYGINYILNHPIYKPTFDAYFKYPYSLEEVPQNPVYKPALDIGLHGGVNITKGTSVFVDINFSNLKYEQYFTILVDDPTNKSISPTYEQFPIFGKEKRINFNLGAQIALFKTINSKFYWDVFGNFNSIKLERNYVVINREYQINHSLPQAQISQIVPGEIGFGVGSGLGFKYNITEKVWLDLNYNFLYTNTRMNDNIGGAGINNLLTFRILWN